MMPTVEFIRQIERSLARFRGLTGFALIACSAGTDNSLTVVVRDSAGVAIIENRVEPSTQLRWIRDATPLLEVGRMDGVGPDVFGFLSHVTRLPSGEIVAADAASREIRIFGDDGVHVRTIGRRGAGPGEFSSLSWTGSYRDSIVVFDGQNGRVSIFALNGELGRTFQLPRTTSSPPYVVGQLQDGTLLVRAFAPPSQEAPNRTRMFLYVVGIDGEVYRELGEYSDRDVGQNGLALAFGSRAFLALRDTLIWYGVNDRFDIRAVAPDGSTRMIVRVERPPQQVTPEEVSATRSAIQEHLSEAGGDPALVQRLLETEFAQTHPVHDRLLVDDLGNLWVAQSRSEPVEFMDHGSAWEYEEAWSVFDADGQLLGMISTPAGFRATHAGEGFVLGIYTDRLGVQRLRMHHMDRR